MIVFLFFVFSALAQEYTLKTDHVPPMKVGDQVLFKVLELEESKTDYQFNIENREKISDMGFEVLENTHGQLVVVFLQKGSLTVPALPILNAEGKVLGKTKPFSLEVESAIAKDDPNPEEPAGIELPAHLKFPWSGVLFIGLLVIVLLAFVLWGLKKISQKKRGPVTFSKPLQSEVTLAEDAEALQALLKLENQNLLASSKYKLYYFSISEILKKYLGRRFTIDAQESTTQELMSLLESTRGVEPKVIDHIESIFTELDRIKFTDQTPTQKEGVFIMEEAKRLIQMSVRPKTHAI